MLLPLLLALVGGAGFAGQPIDAASPEVVWTTPRACVDEGEFRRQLGALVAEPTDETVQLGATNTDGGRWTVVVEFRGVRRVLSSDDCRVLEAAAALVVAVRIDAVATAGAIGSAEIQRPSEPRPQEPVPEEPQPDPKPQAPPEESARVPPPEPLASRSSPIPPPKFAAGLGGGGDVGSLPRGGVALLADAGVRWPRASVAAGFVGVVGPASRANAVGVRGAFRTWSGVARGCGVLSIGSWEAPLCGGFELGVMQAFPRGLTAGRDVNALWLAPTAGVRLQRWFGRLAPAFFVDLALPLRRHQFETADAGTLHSLPPLVVRAGVAIRFRGR